MINNFDWMKEFSLIDFSREVGKHITVNYMMSKESVKKELVMNLRKVCLLQSSPIS